MPVIAQEAKPALDSAPLTSERIEIYRVFLESYMKDNAAVIVNLANETDPLPSWSKWESWAPKESTACFQGIEFEDLEKAQSTIHFIDFQLLFPGQIVMVNSERWDDSVRDISAGLLTLSEISFDKQHHRAVMSFSFVCGNLCGKGWTIVFQKIDGKWREIQRCAGWIS